MRSRGLRLNVWVCRQQRHLGADSMDAFQVGDVGPHMDGHAIAFAESYELWLHILNQFPCLQRPLCVI